MLSLISEVEADDVGLDTSHLTPYPKQSIAKNSPKVSVKSQRAKYKSSLKQRNLSYIIHLHTVETERKKINMNQIQKQCFSPLTPQMGNRRRFSKRLMLKSLGIEEQGELEL